jgi:hypothetical protein
MSKELTKTSQYRKASLILSILLAGTCSSSYGMNFLASIVDSIKGPVVFDKSLFKFESPSEDADGVITAVATPIEQKTQDLMPFYDTKRDKKIPFTTYVNVGNWFLFAARFNEWCEAFENLKKDDVFEIKEVYTQKNTSKLKVYSKKNNRELEDKLLYCVTARSRRIGETITNCSENINHMCANAGVNLVLTRMINEFEKNKLDNKKNTEI